LKFIRKYKKLDKLFIFLTNRWTICSWSWPSNKRGNS